MVSSKPVVLLGFMGSGKSTLGKQLAALLGWDFIDLDRFIETLENRTIPEIFSQDGEAAFRRSESFALQKVLSYKNKVIAIGGGAPCQPENLKLIKEKSLLKLSKSSLFSDLGKYFFSMHKSIELPARNELKKDYKNKKYHKYVIVLPFEDIKRANLKEGDELISEIRNKEIILKKK